MPERSMSVGAIFRIPAFRLGRGICHCRPLTPTSGRQLPSFSLAMIATLDDGKPVGWRLAFSVDGFHLHVIDQSDRSLSGSSARMN